MAGSSDHRWRTVGSHQSSRRRTRPALPVRPTPQLSAARCRCTRRGAPARATRARCEPGPAPSRCARCEASERGNYPGRMTERPLNGIRVLDFTRVLSGPHATRMLCDLGADVIKVEPPEGDITRTTNPRVNSLASYFIQQNAGKRSVSLDTRKREAIDLLLRLSESCDVLIENFRPGVMDRQGLGYEAVAAGNARIIYASINGYGSDGPW